MVPEMGMRLAEFFRLLANAREGEFFQPHPFTEEQASAIAGYQGLDVYAVALWDSAVVGYGMLRGWDEGYDIPSLGVTVHPDFRGAGIGLALMHYLHVTASLRGCSKVRLRVRRDNHRAKRLYEKVGYRFEDGADEYLLAFMQLKRLSTDQSKQS